MPHKNRETRLAYNKAYYNRVGYVSHQAYQQRLKLETFEAYGGPHCVQCGFTDIRALNLDHMAGGGSKERRAGGSATIYNKLKKNGFPPGYQVLCANCNSIKKYTHKEFRGR